MADPARGAVRASRLETFHRILRLEEERGYGDRAVMGGLDRFLAAWRQELEQEPQGALLDHLTRLGVFQGQLRFAHSRGAGGLGEAACWRSWPPLRTPLPKPGQPPTALGSRGPCLRATP